MEHLNRKQVISLLRHARSGGERDWVLFLVTFWHGLRASEAVGLTRENFADGYLRVERLKGSLRTVQPLIEDREKLLNERAAVEGWIEKLDSLRSKRRGRPTPGQRLFAISRIQFWRLFRRYGRRAGLPQHLCHPHALKHSIAMQSIEKAGIENVRQYLGHKSISSTGAYLRVNDVAASRAVRAATRD